MRKTGKCVRMVMRDILSAGWFVVLSYGESVTIVRAANGYCDLLNEILPHNVTLGIDGCLAASRDDAEGTLPVDRLVVGIWKKEVMTHRSSLPACGACPLMRAA